MSFYIDHPDTWIGVPESWPFPGVDGAEFEGPEQWADALVDEFHQLHDLTTEQREHVRSIMLMVALRSAESGVRHFVAFMSWDGPAYIVEAEPHVSAVLGTRTLAEFAGEEDFSQMGRPFVEDVVTESGILGVRCYRYLTYDEKTASVYGRLDYVFRHEDRLMTFRGAELDLEHFETLKAIVEPLAFSLRWQD